VGRPLLRKKGKIIANPRGDKVPRGDMGDLATVKTLPGSQKGLEGTPGEGGKKNENNETDCVRPECFS